MCLPLYSQPKHSRFQTSAQPLPPVVLVAPRSKQYHEPSRSASVGVSSSRRLHRSMKWECDAALSVSSIAFHFEMKSIGWILMRTAFRPGCERPTENYADLKLVKGGSESTHTREKTARDRGKRG